MEDKIIRVSDLKKVPIINGRYDKEHGNRHFIYGVEFVMDMINEIPAYDPVKHGKWVRYFDCQENYSIYHCSECKGEPYYESDIIEEYKYCPYCGAQMDREG